MWQRFGAANAIRPVRWSNQDRQGYPTADEVWLHAKEAGLVIDKIPEERGERHVFEAIDLDLSFNCPRARDVSIRSIQRPQDAAHRFRPP